MENGMLRGLRAALLIVILCILAGCGSGGTGIKVKGTLVHNGQPLKPAPKEDDTLEISFYPFDVKDTTKGGTAAVYNHADGTFAFGGQAGVGLVPGDYRILVRFEQYGSEKGDLFNEEFAPLNSPLKYTITSDREQEVVIDVGKKTVERKQ